jgi:hypothetical protein
MSTNWLLTACSTISFVLRVDRELDVVADSDLGVGGHRPAIGIG